jgi:hypothetical protein
VKIARVVPINDTAFLFGRDLSGLGTAESVLWMLWIQELLMPAIG